VTHRDLKSANIILARDPGGRLSRTPTPIDIKKCSVGKQIAIRREAIMAFNNVGFFTIAPGQRQRIFVTFGGADHGAQAIHAQPLNPGGFLQVNDQAKVLNNDGTFTYWVNVTNIGSVTTNYSVQGGGYV